MSRRRLSRGSRRPASGLRYKARCPMLWGGGLPIRRPQPHDWLGSRYCLAESMRLIWRSSVATIELRATAYSAAPRAMALGGGMLAA